VCCFKQLRGKRALHDHRNTMYPQKKSPQRTLLSIYRFLWLIHRSHLRKYGTLLLLYRTEGGGVFNISEPFADKQGSLCEIHDLFVTVDGSFVDVEAFLLCYVLLYAYTYPNSRSQHLFFEKIAPRTCEKSPVDISKEPCRHVKRALRVLKHSTKHKHKEPHTCEHPTRVEYEA